MNNYGLHSRSAFEPKISESSAIYIRKNYLENTVSEMAASIHVPVRHIYEWMGENEMPTLDKTKRKKSKVAEGYFDCDEKDWFIGNK